MPYGSRKRKASSRRTYSTGGRRGGSGTRRGTTARRGARTQTVRIVVEQPNVPSGGRLGSVTPDAPVLHPGQKLEPLSRGKRKSRF